jgi:hypothetical protein
MRAYTSHGHLVLGVNADDKPFRGSVVHCGGPGLCSMCSNEAFDIFERGRRMHMMNPKYHIDRMREVLDEFEPGRERSLAAEKLDECELWLTRCKPTKEALERDQASWQLSHCGGPDICSQCAKESSAVLQEKQVKIEGSLAFDALLTVLRVLLESGLTETMAVDAIRGMQRANILFRKGPS